jgi:transposase
VSTLTLGGHVNTFPQQAADTRRRRRLHSDEFKANVVATCMQPGMSMAAVAMANGINANLLRRWVCEAQARPANGRPKALPAPKPAAPTAPAAFVPVQLAACAPAADIRIELRRGTTAISVSWPTEAATDCAAWMRELLR